MYVHEVSKEIADLFVREKHYSRRQGFFRKAFGLMEHGCVVGTAVFGEPPLQVVKHCFTDRTFPLLELVRVVVQTDTKNAASFLIGNSLKLLDQPSAVVSYADSSWGHCGIIYQATNWFFCGSTVSHDSLYLVNGERIHPRTLAARGITNPKQWAKDNGIETIAPSPKHRYVYLCGNKYHKRDMLAKLKWPIHPDYPKTEKSRYDDGPRLVVSAPIDLLGRDLA